MAQIIPSQSSRVTKSTALPCVLCMNQLFSYLWSFMEDSSSSRKRSNSDSETVVMFKSKKHKEEPKIVSKSNNNNEVSSILEKGSMGYDFGTFLQLEEGFDVTFIVGSSKEKIKAHRLVLAARSKVFHSMLFGHMKESTNIEIPIPDVEAPVFRKMIQFMYSDTVPISPEDVLPILYCARKYDLPGLTGACLEFINNEENADAWDEESIFIILEHASLFEEVALMEKAMQIVGKHTDEILASSRMLNISADLLKRMVMSSALVVESEMVVFQTCLKWSEHECKRNQLAFTPENRRKVLLDVLPHLRFPTLTPEELSVVRASGILTTEELLDIYEYINLGTKRNTKSFYPTQPRKGKKLQILLDKNASFNQVTISSDGLNARGPINGSYAWARGTPLLAPVKPKLQYTWRVRVDRKNNLWGPSIGVCTQNAPISNSWVGNETYWWFLDSYTGFEMYGNGAAQYPDRSGNKLRDGDIVTVILDFATQEIVWAVNDEDPKTTTKRLRLPSATEPLYPLFGLHGNSEITIL